MNNLSFRLVGVVLAAVLPLMAGCSSETTGPNRPPVAVAGEDRAVALDESVTLSGVASYDPDGDMLTSYRWTLVAAPEGASATLSTDNGMTTELTPDVTGVWVVRLVVSDGKRDSEPDVVQVRVGGGPPCTIDQDCDDGEYCNGAESCVDGRCQPGAAPDCSDGDVCTQDVCNEDLDRCENPPVTEAPGTEGPVGDATCSDGADNDCDGLTDGADTGCIVCTTDADCDDHNECTDDSCSGGACVNTPVNDGTACDDGQWCTDDGSGGGDVCQNGRCVGQQERDCSGAGDQCNDFACDEQADACVAVPVADGTNCDDGLWCTENDECTNGVCGGTQRDCSGSAGECEVGVCNEDLDRCEVQAVADGGSCDDGEYCTVGETCLSGSCQGGGPRDCTGVADECNDEACDDTADACVPIPRADGTECGTRVCNVLEWTREICVAGACTGSDIVQNCDDGRDCTTDACDAVSGCSNTALSDGSECGARYCDGLEHRRQTCLSGVCSGSELLANCGDANECTTDTCDGATGCGNAAVSDGTECGARYCSSLEWRRETCQSGQCSGNALQQNCDDTNVCTDDACDAASGCSNTNNTDNCDDGDACTMNDVCANGLCSGVPLDGDGDGHVDENCPSGDDCDDSRANVYPGFFEGSFGDAVCSDGLDNDCDGLTDTDDDTCQECTTDADCDDNNVCNGAETCVGVACQAGTPLTCDDGVYCNGLETCDPVSGCQAASNPCPETECNHCNETDNNCFDPVGTACSDDGEYCTGVEECDGAGSCESSGNPCLPETECNHCNETAGNCYDPSGTACSDDGDYCTGVEECNGAGACVSSGNPCLPETECNHCNESTNSCFDPLGTACSEDGLYCNGVEECDGAGTCISSGVSPCQETPCNTCQEDTDSCFDPEGTFCGSSSDTACTDRDTCDGAGNCQDNHAPPDTPCDDGEFCTGSDTCDGAGVCDNHSGDPCLGGDECNAHCNEDTDDCYDPDGTFCGDPTDDDCTDRDTCDGAGDCQDNHAGAGTTCDDGLYCTITDTCDGAGKCEGTGSPCAPEETCLEGTDTYVCVTCQSDEECPECQYCHDGSCENQPAGEDYKDDCTQTECVTGDCDGAGGCEYEPPTTACGDDSESDCDHADHCDGAGGCDPNYAPEDDPCGDQGVPCHIDDTCDGAGNCVDNGFESEGALCGSGNDDDCDNQDTCDDSGSCLDNYEAAGTQCPDLSPNDCDDAQCDGSGGCDQSRGVEADTYPCLPKSDLCDIEDLCDGIHGGACPSDDVQPDTYLCGPAEDDCDLEEYCDGTSKACPADQNELDGTPCLGSDLNLCNSTCQGGVCIDGANAAAGESCDDGYTCTTPDQCDGAGNCDSSPDDAFCESTGSVGDLCRPQCFNGTTGCGTPPASMSLACTPEPVPLSNTDTATCDLDLAGVAGQIDCLSCTSEVGLVLIDYADFNDGSGGCGDDGWRLVPAGGSRCTEEVSGCSPGGGSIDCCANFADVCESYTFGFPTLRSDQNTNCGGDEEWRIFKVFDVSGLTDLSVCFNYAEAGADDDEGLLLYVQDGANSAEQVFCRNDGPAVNVNWFFYRMCVDLPAWADNSPDLQLLFIAHSDQDNDIIFLDNIELRGWLAGCAETYLTLFTETFTGCDTSNWTVSGNPKCPGDFACGGGGDNLGSREVNYGDVWSIDRVVDVSALDGDINLCFDVGDDNANNSDDYVYVEFDAGGGWQGAWYLDSNFGPDDTCTNVCANLSSLNAAVNRNPALGIRFTVRTDSRNDYIVLDNITLFGAQYCDGVAIGAVELGPMLEAGGGAYSFTARDIPGTQMSADIFCSWDTPPEGGEVEAMDTVDYVP